MNTNELDTLAADLFAPHFLISASLTGPRVRLPESLLKVEIKPVLLRGEYKFQFACHQNRKVTHRNLTGDESRRELVTLLSEQFRQGEFHSAEGDIVVTLNKRKEVAIRRTARTDNKQAKTNGPANDLVAAKSAPAQLVLQHDRAKNHILPEGQAVPFLVRLGVMSGDGKVLAAKRDKFRQINRFLEMVADVVEPLEARLRQNPERPLRIVDFGCGKAYLTFALYHYLHDLRGLHISLVGVDRKQDVLDSLSVLARELNYAALSFLPGDIQDVNLDGVWKTENGSQKTEENTIVNPQSSLPNPEHRILNTEHRTPDHPDHQPSTINHQPSIDMVVALHACDTATDDALVRAITWNAQVILAAPCCQHELFHKIQNETMLPMLQHGIIRERLASLITDTLRAELLTLHGYQVQMLEFVDLEHTPKNILIRAVRRDGELNTAKQQAAQEIYARFRDFWHVQPIMEQALAQTMSNHEEVDSRQ